MRAWCASLRKIELPDSQRYDKLYDPSGWRVQSGQMPCVNTAPPPRPHKCGSSSHRPQSKKPRDGEGSIQDPCYPQYPRFRLPPIPPENCFDKHSSFNETLLGSLDYHDYSARKYYRIFQNRFDLDIIRRFVPYNLCKTYPTATTRYFAFNWPECCIIAFTDTHIPIGIIMAHQMEPRRARITMLAVEQRIDENDVYKNLMLREIQRLRKNDIHAVVLLPVNGDTKKRLLRIFGDTGPLRRVNDQGEFQFYI
uniref:N acetyltransferase mak3 n=1 Tax=Echinococcus granulosus TaxID=6210 RepID=A0A068WJN0_ECHGR|nr:n acetyltransferase mak3 [Echinococcus granulosus]